MAARSGDRQAFATLIARHYPLLLMLCRRRLQDSALAEDAAQEAVIQALLSLERLRNPERFGSWLAGIGLNMCRRWLDHRRQTGISWEMLCGDGTLRELSDWRPGPDEMVEMSELRIRVRSVVEGLPPGQREAVLLFYLADLTQVETALLLGVEVSAVKSRLYKARANLRRRLQSKRGKTMSGQDASWIPFHVVDVRRQALLPAGEPDTTNHLRRHWLVLEEVDGTRRSIWGIPPFEAEALALKLHDVEPLRPSPYTLTAQLVQVAGGRLQAVLVELLAERVVGARIRVASNGGEQEIAARASDAINLALISDVPILLAATMLSNGEEESDEDRQAVDQVYAEGNEDSAAIVADLVSARNSD